MEFLLKGLLRSCVLGEISARTMILGDVRQERVEAIPNLQFGAKCLFCCRHEGVA